jgi:hypothetical protein
LYGKGIVLWTVSPTKIVNKLMQRREIGTLTIFRKNDNSNFFNCLLKT